MAKFIQYTLEDGSELLVELVDEGEGATKAGLEEAVEKAKKSFDDALESARLSALQIRKKFHEVAADEVEVKFGLKATGEVGNNIFAIGKAGVEANYEVTLKWVKKEARELDDRIAQIKRRRLMKKTWLR